MDSFKIKAIERLETAKWCMDKDFTSSCVSNLYFAYFNFFQYVIGEPPKGRWKHIGIAKAFVYKAYRESLCSECNEPFKSKEGEVICDECFLQKTSED